jgi:hypothetical protein
MKAMKNVWAMIGIGIVVLFLAIQFVPVDRANPAVQTQVPASAEARAILKRACYDCHSNQTVWPWYSYVAPMSWLVAKDVKEGREKLNYSTWNLMSAEEQAEGVKESWEKIQSGEMPLWFYLPLHPEAKLSPADRAVLQAWASGGATTGTGVGTEGTSGTGTEGGAGTSTGSGTDGTSGLAPTTGTGATGGTTGGTGTMGTSGAGGGTGGATGGTVTGTGGGEGGESGEGGGDSDNDGD